MAIDFATHDQAVLVRYYHYFQWKLSFQNLTFSRFYLAVYQPSRWINCPERFTNFAGESRCRSSRLAIIAISRKNCGTQYKAQDAITGCNFAGIANKCLAFRSSKPPKFWFLISHFVRCLRYLKWITCSNNLEESTMCPVISRL